MRGVLSPSGTRLAPTEAARRPVACCFERPEQLLFYNDLQLFRAMQIFCQKCESCLHERTLLTENLFGEQPHRDEAQRNRDGL